MLLVVVSDPVGIRTRDPQLRRLLLYPAELPDLVGMRLSHERHFSVSLGLPRFLLLTQTREVWVILRPWSLCISLSAFKEQFACAKARQKTYIGTQNSAYKGNLGAKVLLFLELCKYFRKKMQNITKVPQKVLVIWSCSLHLRYD